MKAIEQPSGTSLQSQPFRPLGFLKCLREGHEFVYSRVIPGRVTCRRCRVRRRP